MRAQKAPRYRLKSRNNHDRVERLFTRGNPGWSNRDCVFAYDPLIAAFGAGRVKMRVSRLSASARKAGLAIRYHGGRTESAHHFALKQSARAWMIENGATDAYVEQRCFVGRADAYSEKQSWAVECGCTAIGKLVAAIQSGEVRFTLIPFQGHPFYWDEAEAPAPIAIDFLWTPDLTDEFQRHPYGRSNQSTDQIVAEMHAAYLARRASLPSTLTGGTV